MKTLDKTKIARILHAERKGKVSAKGGYFGALQLFAEVNKRFRVPEGGGRATDPAWTERRLLPLRPQTLKRLQKISNSIQKHQHVSIEPMQLAALLVEKTTEELTEEEVEKLVTASKL
ncbi:hypothetical protein L0156_15930 [bacterium]|nr:hypothetical protein [bacterium]